MTPREVVRRNVLFEGPDRLAMSFPDKFGNDFAGVGMNPSPDARGQNGRDEWGCLWHNIGVCGLGEVSEFPLREWDDMKRIKIPDISESSAGKLSPGPGKGRVTNFSWHGECPYMSASISSEDLRTPGATYMKIRRSLKSS